MAIYYCFFFLIREVSSCEWQVPSDSVLANLIDRRYVAMKESPGLNFKLTSSAKQMYRLVSEHKLLVNLSMSGSGPFLCPYVCGRANSSWSEISVFLCPLYQRAGSSRKQRECKPKGCAFTYVVGNGKNNNVSRFWVLACVWLCAEGCPEKCRSMVSVEMFLRNIPTGKRHKGYVSSQMDVLSCLCIFFWSRVEIHQRGHVQEFPKARVERTFGECWGQHLWEEAQRERCLLKLIHSLWTLSGLEAWSF